MWGLFFVSHWAVPFMAKLLDSVAPDVQTTSSRSAFNKLATCCRALLHGNVSFLTEPVRF